MEALTAQINQIAPSQVGSPRPLFLDVTRVDDPDPDTFERGSDTKFPLWFILYRWIVIRILHGSFIHRKKIWDKEHCGDSAQCILKCPLNTRKIVNKSADGKFFYN